MREFCQRCTLSDAGISNCIARIGEGKVLVVGSAPNAEEDLQDLALSGPVGTLIRSMFSDAGYAESDYSYTFAVRCITGNKKPPTRESILACRHHLTQEIKALNPSAIIAMGDVALVALTGRSGISGKRGQPLPLDDSFGSSVEVYPTYNPIFVLKTPNARATVISDLRRVRDRDLEAKVVQSVEGKLAVGSALAYDIETYDEEGKITDDMTQIAVASANGLLVSNDREHAVRIVHDIAKWYKGDLVSHFGWDFDDAKTGLHSTYDTAAMAYLDDETQPLGLESLCVKYLGVKGWKEARDGAKLGTQELRDYNMRDAENTLVLFHYLRDKLQEHSRNGVPRIRVLTDILRPLRAALDECSRRGIFVNAQAVAEEKEKQGVRIEHLRKKVTAEAHAIIGEHAFDKQLKTKVRSVPFNPGSPLHVGKVLEAAGMFLPETSSGQLQTNVETLERINHPFARTELDWRTATKKMSTYILPYEAAANSESGRMYSRYTEIRTLTGRTSASGRNVQNLDRELKAFLHAPPGYTLVRADYEQLEFWVAVWMADIQRLIDLRLNDPTFDAHRWFAAQLYGIPEASVTKAQRQIAKSANFGLLYLGGPSTLINYAAGYGIMLSPREAARIYAAFHASYPEFRPWWGRVQAEMIEFSYVESPTGRRRHTGDTALLRAGGNFEQAHREAVNALVQGFSTGDIAELGLSSAYKAHVPIVGYIHDEILAEYPTEALNRDKAHIEATIRKAMIDEPIRILRERFNVDFPAHLLKVDFTYVQG